MIDEINKLKKERNALILAHNYQLLEVIDAADYVGDSFYLSDVAKKSDKDVIVLCGVHFMAESAKILSPEKTVLLPVLDAGCPLADMVDTDKLSEYKKKHPDAAFVCYINTTAEVKALCDVVVTSSNALKIIKKLDNKKIVFLPDKNLGEYIKEQVPEKEIILWEGFCPTHKKISKESILMLKDEIKDLVVLAHPECEKDVRDISDFVGSTKEIIEYATNTNYKNYLIATEEGVIHTLKRDNPHKNFYAPGKTATCPNMKKTRISDVYECLLYMKHEIKVDEEVAEKARRALENMLLLAR